MQQQKKSARGRTSKYPVLIFFDTEDNSEELFATCPGLKVAKGKVVTLICAMNAQGEKFSWKGSAGVPKFKEWLSQQAPCKVYAFNIGYDLGNLFRHELDELDVLLVGGRMIKARWGNVIFLDVANLWPFMSVEKLGKTFKLPKLAKDAQNVEYCMRDVEIIRLAILYVNQLAEQFAVDISNTIGGLSVKLWRAQGGKNWNFTDARAMEAYYGGRTEIWTRGGEGNFAWCDINSMYPHCMTKEFPECAEPCNDLPEYGVASVDLRIPDCIVAPLPSRLEDGRIIYPVGKLTGTWTAHEIRNAVEHGATIHRLHWAIGCKGAQKYYRPYIDRWYKKRNEEEKESAPHTFYKYLLNNLYGQLCTRGNVLRSLNIEILAEGTVYGNKRLAKVNFPLPEHTNYLHAAYITSYGRILLQDYLRQVEQFLVYCDTDSVIFHNRDSLPWHCSDSLGEMKLEGYAKKCEVIQPKIYRYGDKLKCKGVPKKFAEEFVKNGCVEFQLPYKFREAVNWYDRDNAKPLSVWRKITKSLHGQYDRKEWKKDVYSPLTVKQW